ncbi:hypothetical protein MLD38_015870 [Melastoma candidum]|uniref:Uncharacterized protein n=1 Tax=Melastoma candidum TaxID=119954 RepID=A0ACB9RIR4_9MYRT|nr:hypothetical protein MLD38_015870 [Melastoma candidum]
MGDNVLSPLVKEEILSRKEGSDACKSAMEALKADVKQLDPRDLPLFFTWISDAIEIGSEPVESLISLYELVARVQGANVIPHIDKIVGSITHNLAANVVSSPLQQACSKVVIAIVRYGIGPTTSRDEKKRIIHSLGEPLSNSLLSCRESLSLGAALCLKALVDSDKWQFASDEMVNTVCQNVAAALMGKSTQSNPHMGLASSLAEHNPLIVEAYARLLIQSCLQILQPGSNEANPHKRRSAIQLLHILMKYLHPSSVYSDLKGIVKEMERLKSDDVHFVRGAALEACETAGKIAAEEEMKLQMDSGFVAGSNIIQRRGVWRNGCNNSREQSSGSALSDPHVSISSRLASSGSKNDRRSVNRKLWRFENGGVDIPVKDNLFSGLGNEDSLAYISSGDSGNQGSDNDMCNCSDCFQGSCMNGEEGPISVPTPQVSQDSEDSGDMGIFRIMQTPARSVEIASPGEMNWESPKGRFQRFRSTPVCRNKPDFMEETESCGPSEVNEITKATGVSNDIIDHNHNGVFSRTAEQEVILKHISGSGIDYRRWTWKVASLGMICSIFLIGMTLGTSLLSQFEVDNLVPT